MKKILASLLLLTGSLAVQAQQKEGKVIYQRTTQFNISFSAAGGPPPGIEQAMPKSRTDRFELNFANNQMVLKQLEEEIQDDNFSGGPNVQFRTIGGGGADDVTFCDFTTRRKTELREFMDKKYLISDSISKGNWKLGEETKTILNHLCRKATSQRTGKRMQTVMENGKVERKEVADTAAIVAWFTTDIPVAASPEAQGQLPGLVLELDINNGRQVYTAVSIDPKAAVATIKEPTKGKKVTREEFDTARTKALEEMQRNMGGNGRAVRIVTN